MVKEDKPLEPPMDEEEKKLLVNQIVRGLSAAVWAWAKLTLGVNSPAVERKRQKRREGG